MAVPFGGIANPPCIADGGGHRLFNEGSDAGFDIGQCDFGMGRALRRNDDAIERRRGFLALGEDRHRNIAKALQRSLDIATPSSVPCESKP